MIKKLCIIILLMICIITPVSAVYDVYTITNTTTDSSINMIFTPTINENATLSFDGKHIEARILNHFYIDGLDSNRGYQIIINDSYNDVYHSEIIYTDSTEIPPFYAQYGVLGLFLLIVVMLFLSTKIPIIGYASIALSTLGIIYVLKNSNEFIELLIFVVLLATSLLTMRD